MGCPCRNEPEEEAVPRAAVEPEREQGRVLVEALEPAREAAAEAPAAA